MPRLPEIVLDDRHFQDLVNEARVRVARHCPEWTDHNVSDPGITLIELFALPSRASPALCSRNASTSSDGHPSGASTATNARSDARKRSARCSRDG